MKNMSKIFPAALLLATSLSAQALTPGSGAWVKESATYGTPNLQNAYVYVPKNAAPEIKNGKRALMLTMHACSMTAPGNVINGKFNWEETAEKYGMVVIAPTAPFRLYNCWDWTGSNFTRTSRDAVPLKKLIDAVRNRPELDIDPNQIYVAGISSGGVETQVMSCAFPEIFAGAGIVAAPVLGSKDASLTVTAEQMVSYCKAANGNTVNDAFNTQITSLVHGTADGNVPVEHTTRTQEGRALLYGGIDLRSCQNVAAPSGTIIQECPDRNGNIRLSKIIIDGLKHEWPAGGGTGATMVNRNTINYPAYVTEWFFKNNLRASNPCDSMTLSPSEIQFSWAGGVQTVNVTADPQCNWTAVEGDQEIGSGSGTGSFNVVRYSLRGYGGSQSVVKVGTKQISVTQKAECTYTLSPTYIDVPADGTSGTIKASLVDGTCSYQDEPRSDSAWVTPGHGQYWPLEITYTVSKNQDTTQRSAKISYLGQTVTINQAAGAAPAPCYTDLNYKHVMAKRAAYRYTPTFGVTAKGSNADLGSFTKTTSLKMTQPDYYEPVNSCQ